MNFTSRSSLGSQAKTVMTSDSTRPGDKIKGGRSCDVVHRQNEFFFFSSPTLDKASLRCEAWRANANGPPCTHCLPICSRTLGDDARAVLEEWSSSPSLAAAMGSARVKRGALCSVLRCITGSRAREMKILAIIDEKKVCEAIKRRTAVR